MALSAFLVLSGASLLLGRPSYVLLIPSAETEASVAYGSKLVVTYDGATSGVEVLAMVGGILILGGLMISATAFGRRLGQEESNAE